MKLVLATKLSIEECTKRLNNAIDPIPLVAERGHKPHSPSLSPDPLPDAGRRVTGFGYSPGTRPVLGTIKDGVFHFEKREPERIGSGPNRWIANASECNGRL